MKWEYFLPDSGFTLSLWRCVCFVYCGDIITNKLQDWVHKCSKLSLKFYLARKTSRKSLFRTKQVLYPLKTIWIVFTTERVSFHNIWKQRKAIPKSLDLNVLHGWSNINWLNKYLWSIKREYNFEGESVALLIERGLFCQIGALSIPQTQKKLKKERNQTKKKLSENFEQREDHRRTLEDDLMICCLKRRVPFGH